jgi:lysozyme
MSIKFVDASKYDKGLPHQLDAWEYLQQNTPPHVLVEFEKRFRNQKADNLYSGISLIKEFENIELVAYPDPKTKGKPYTVGWGSTRKKDGTPFKLGERITQKEADELFDYQIQNEFLPQLRKIPYWEEMNVNQRGALLCFAYNLGADFYGSPDFNTITRVLKNKEWSKVPEALKLYRNPGTDVEAGLLRRRIAEGKLWMS